MHRTTATAAAVLLLAALVGCSDGDEGGDGKPKPTKSTAAGLAGEWGPKLSAATDGKDAVP
ncbi:hypothetical protein [Streptomyces sp. WAC 04229]|uniref:hypothetical protein n=1 Tax=Streptomyces sp. WAC 04229 TaxID=2203206 RepID=UPI003D75DD5B